GTHLSGRDVVAAAWGGTLHGRTTATGTTLPADRWQIVSSMNGRYEERSLSAIRQRAIGGVKESARAASPSIVGHGSTGSGIRSAPREGHRFSWRETGGDVAHARQG